eukprot:TRINITY_DN55145_c0_g1_i1.p1 TRINITY_DN55145_c0_g1~~TRINITY_DN55145_c0_g1_i1.p1  ORF type:complete len:351 (+),score=9.29 TRINITY_DN55145_c0_g1_i1:29-1054(+)
MQTHLTEIDKAFAAFADKLQSIQTKIHEEFDHATDEDTKATSTQDKVDNSSFSPEDKKITLNVGGSRFVTTESTLLTEKENFFWAMLNSGAWTPDDDGEYFIDRSPMMFPVILEVLRSGRELKLEYFDEFSRQILASDIDYYQIQSLLPLLTKTEETAHPGPSEAHAMRWMDILGEGPDNALISHSWGFSSVKMHAGVANKRLFKATFPHEPGQPEIRTWAVTMIRQTSKGDWPLGFVGIGEAENLENRVITDNSVFVESQNGDLYQNGKLTIPSFVKFGKGGKMRAVIFSYNFTDSLVFVSGTSRKNSQKSSLVFTPKLGPITTFAMNIPEVTVELKELQ